MAQVLQTFRHLSVASARGALKTLIPATQTSHARTLYSLTTLGVEQYVNQRGRTETQLGNISDKFRLKMEEYADEESKNMIFTEDLKNMIHLANENDVSLIMKMMYKFNEQNKTLRFGTFVFGPIVMRMFYHLNKPQEAIECFNSSRLDGFFTQLISFQLLLDLLYENKMYKEMLTTFETIQARQFEGTKYARNIVVLTMAACYKLNTEDSCKYALNLWNSLKEAGHFPMRRATTYCAALALNHNQPDACLEILVCSKNQNYTTVRNLKALALTSIGRLDEAVLLLKSVLEHDGNVNIKHTFNRDVINEVQAAVEKAGNADLLTEMNRIQKYFAEQGHISDGTLDQQLCEEIKTPPFMGQNRQPFSQNRNQGDQGNYRYNSYNRNENRYQGDRARQPFKQRPGLNEIN